jgi:hypothetical protein
VVNGKDENILRAATTSNGGKAGRDTGKLSGQTHLLPLMLQKQSRPNSMPSATESFRQRRWSN